MKSSVLTATFALSAGTAAAPAEIAKRFWPNSSNWLPSFSFGWPPSSKAGTTTLQPSYGQPPFAIPAGFTPVAQAGIVSPTPVAKSPASEQVQPPTAEGLDSTTSPQWTQALPPGGAAKADPPASPSAPAPAAPTPVTVSPPAPAAPAPAAPPAPAEAPAAAAPPSSSAGKIASIGVTTGSDPAVCVKSLTAEEGGASIFFPGSHTKVTCFKVGAAPPRSSAPWWQPQAKPQPIEWLKTEAGCYIKRTDLSFTTRDDFGRLLAECS